METENAVDVDGLSFDLSDDISSIGEIPGTQHVVKLLLPEIHSDVAKALLCYLYTGMCHVNTSCTYVLSARPINPP